MISSQALREFLRQSILARVGFIAGVILVVAALLAPWIAPADPAAQNLPARLESPSRAHWMGTDELGRDILSRTLYGARISLLVSVCVVCGCGLIGLTMGMLAGYAGGWWDRVINLLLVNAFLSFPGILLAIAFAAVRIMARHLLPNILQPILIQATIGMAGAILAESTLSFLGLGVLAPIPSWGAMLNDARGHLFDAPHMVVFPASAVMTAVLSFNLLGDAWRDWLDPRMRSQMAAQEFSR